MIRRLGLVVYWVCTILAGSFATLTFVFSTNGMDYTGVLIFLIISIAIFGAGWAIRFVLTGIKRLFP